MRQLERQQSIRNETVRDNRVSGMRQLERQQCIRNETGRETTKYPELDNKRGNKYYKMLDVHIKVLLL